MIEIVEISLRSLLLGFGAYTLLFLIVRLFFPEFKRIVFNEFDSFACAVAAAIGSIYLLFWILELLVENQCSTCQFDFIQRSNMPYSLALWIKPLLYSISQLLWLKNVRKKKIPRFIIALLLIIPVEGIVVFLTSFHRDYLPSSWSVPFVSEWKNFMLCLLSFVSLTVLIYLTRLKLKAKANDSKD